MLKVAKNLCLGCGLCARICPQGAITIIGGKAEIDPRRCNSCYQCLDACPQGAILEMVVVSPKELRSTISSLKQQTDDILAKLNALCYCEERVSRSPERSEGGKATSKQDGIDCFDLPTMTRAVEFSHCPFASARDKPRSQQDQYSPP